MNVLLATHFKPNEAKPTIGGEMAPNDLYGFDNYLQDKNKERRLKDKNKFQCYGNMVTPNLITPLQQENFQMRSDMKLELPKQYKGFNEFPTDQFAKDLITKYTNEQIFIQNILNNPVTQRLKIEESIKNNFRIPPDDEFLDLSTEIAELSDQLGITQQQFMDEAHDYFQNMMDVPGNLQNIEELLQNMNQNMEEMNENIQLNNQQIQELSRNVQNMMQNGVLTQPKKESWWWSGLKWLGKRGVEVGITVLTMLIFQQLTGNTGGGVPNAGGGGGDDNADGTDENDPAVDNQSEDIQERLNRIRYDPPDIDQVHPRRGRDAYQQTDGFDNNPLEDYDADLQPPPPFGVNDFPIARRRDRSADRGFGRPDLEFDGAGLDGGGAARNPILVPDDHPARQLNFDDELPSYDESQANHPHQMRERAAAAAEARRNEAFSRPRIAEENHPAIMEAQRRYDNAERMLKANPSPATRRRLDLQRQRAGDVLFYYGIAPDGPTLSGGEPIIDGGQPIIDGGQPIMDGGSPDGGPISPDGPIIDGVGVDVEPGWWNNVDRTPFSGEMPSDPTRVIRPLPTFSSTTASTSEEPLGRMQRWELQRHIRQYRYHGYAQNDNLLTSTNDELREIYRRLVRESTAGGARERFGAPSQVPYRYRNPGGRVGGNLIISPVAPVVPPRASTSADAGPRRHRSSGVLRPDSAPPKRKDGKK